MPDPTGPVPCARCARRGHNQPAVAILSARSRGDVHTEAACAKHRGDAIKAAQHVGWVTEQPLDAGPAPREPDQQQALF